MMHPWFRHAKLGIFIHWGLYAVRGVPESWAMASGQMSCEEYYKMTDGFTAEAYDPREWARYFSAAGATYAVLTTKHHEGFALFDTAYTDLNAVKAAPCHRDLVAPYCDALREAGLKVGLYFTNTDWADDDHMRVELDMTQAELDAMRKVPTEFRNMWHTEPAAADKKAELDACWQRFMTRYKGEITELLTRHQPDVLWTDVMLTREGFSWECPEVKQMIERLSPCTICNGRLGDQGDYETPELYIPLRPLEKDWELCTTFNDSWGYQPKDHNFKDVRQIVRMLCECISKGGNMLISVGPDAQGRLPEETKAQMLALGEWTHKYAEAIYPTLRGLDPAYFLGGSTLTEDRKTLYLFVYDCSTSRIMLNGIRNPIKRITAMGTQRTLQHRIIGGAPWINMPGNIWIELPPEDMDPVCTVIKLEFDEPIDLVALEGQANSVGEN